MDNNTLELPGVAEPVRLRVEDGYSRDAGAVKPALLSSVAHLP